MRDLRLEALFGCSAPFWDALSRAITASLTARSAASTSPDGISLRALVTKVRALVLKGWFLARRRAATRAAFSLGKFPTSSRILCIRASGLGSPCNADNPSYALQFGEKAAQLINALHVDGERYYADVLKLLGNTGGYVNTFL